jgi:hypothetical protein
VSAETMYDEQSVKPLILLRFYTWVLV